MKPKRNLPKNQSNIENSKFDQLFDMSSKFR